MTTPDMRRVNGRNEPRWPVISKVIADALPLGASMGDIRRATGLGTHTCSAYINGYCKDGYVFSAGPRGSKRYYLTRQQADDAAALREANPVKHVRKVPAVRGSIMSVILAKLSESAGAGVTTHELCSVSGCEGGQVRQSLSDLRKRGEVFSAGNGSLRRHFATKAQADAYIADVLPLLEAQREVHKAEQKRASSKVREPRAKQPVAAKPKANPKPKKVTSQKLREESWKHRQAALELREAKRQQKAAERELKEAQRRAAKLAKVGVTSVAGADQVTERSKSVKPIAPQEVIIPAHVKVQRIAHKPGRFEVDPKSVPSIFGSIALGDYLPLPSRVGL